MLRPAALHRHAGALPDLADEGHLLGGPRADRGVVEVEQGDDAVLLGHRHVDEGLGADGPERAGRGGGARVEVRVGAHHRVAALEVVDVGAVVPELQRAGEAPDARGVPVPLDGDGFGHRVDRAVAGPAHPQHAAEHLGGRVGEVGGLVDGAEPVVEVDQRPVARLGPLALRDVEAGAGEAQRLAVGRMQHLGADVEPAGGAARVDDAVFDVVVHARRDALRHGAVHAVAVLRMDGRHHLGVGEGGGGVAPESRLEGVGGVQLPAGQVELPDAEPPRLGGEAQAGFAVLLRPQPVAELGHQGGVPVLQAGQALALQRHVDLAREEIGQDAVRVADGRHQQAVPERLARLAMVADVDLDRPAGLHGLADADHRPGIGLGALQEAAVAADDLLARVAGQAAEGIVDEDDRVVGQAGVRDHHGHARGAHGRREGVGLGVDAGDLGDDVVGVVGLAGPVGQLAQAGDLRLGLGDAPEEALLVGLAHASPPDRCPNVPRDPAEGLLGRMEGLNSTGMRCP